MFCSPVADAGTGATDLGAGECVRKSLAGCRGMVGVKRKWVDEDEEDVIEIERLQEDEEEQERNIPMVELHILCENCRQFCETWDILNDFPSLSPDRPSATRLATVSDLIQTQASCHFCTFILGYLDRRSFVKREDVLDRNVYLRGKMTDDGTCAVSIVIGKEFTTSIEDREEIGSFILETYHDTERGGFNEHFAASCIPLHAEDNVPRVKGWIDTCQQEHKTCQQFEKNGGDRTLRPTRILEVLGDKSIRLQYDIALEQYEYLVLSHMWGPNPEKQLQLVGSRVREFEKSVPWNMLSPLYQEAIRVTRTLGYRYIWIDSLCIIQDSKEDWVYEAQRMAIVYSNAVCNLAFLFPSASPEESKNGPRHPRDDPRIWSPCVLRPATSLSPGLYVHDSYTAFRPIPINPDEDWLVRRDWPLFDRAWTFQEYLLSPRTLLYGHKNLMWQCSHMFYDEILGPVSLGQKSGSGLVRLDVDMSKGRYFPETLKAVASAESLSAQVVLSFMLDWMDLVDEYRMRKLTFSQDRVMAFAGIARMYTQVSGLTYLAGAWMERLPVSLLWFLEKKADWLVRRQNNIPQGSIPIYSAEMMEESVPDVPTWSWFSVPIYRFYRPSFLFNDDEIFSRNRSRRELGRSCFADIFWADTISFEFDSHPANFFPETGFSSFAGLGIRLKMPTWPVSKNLFAELAMQKSTIQASNKLDEDLDWDPDFEYYPDIVDTRHLSPPRKGKFALIAEVQLLRTRGGYHIQRRLAGLVLVPASQSGTWQRVGLWKLKIRISGVAVDDDSMNTVSARWKGYTFISPNWNMESLTLV